MVSYILCVCVVFKFSSFQKRHIFEFFVALSVTFYLVSASLFHWTTHKLSIDCNDFYVIFGVCVCVRACVCHSRGKKDSALSSSMYNTYQKRRRENKQKVNKIDPKCISGGRSGSASGEVGGVLGLPGRGCNMPPPNWTHCRCILRGIFRDFKGIWERFGRV